MKLVFHIGVHKTGTTAFQQICYTNRDILQNLGVIYPSYHHTGQHSVLLRSIQMEGIAALDIYLENLLASKPECHTLLISGEAFEYLMIDTSLAQEMEKVAQSWGFNTIEWVIVWRDAPGHLRSLYGELGKQGIVVDPNTLIRAYNERGYFLATSDKFNYGFALDNVRMFQRFKDAVTGSVIQIDFNDFVDGYPGRVLLQRILLPNDLERFGAKANTVVLTPNTALTSFQIEFRHAAACLGIKRAGMGRIQKMIFLALNFLLIRRRMRNAEDAFKRFSREL